MMEITPQNDNDEICSKVVKETKNILYLKGKESEDIRLYGIAVLIDGFKSAFIVHKLNMNVYKCNADKRSYENLTRKVINSLSTVIDNVKDGYVNKDELARYWISKNDDVYITCLAYRKSGRTLKIGQRLICINHADCSITDSIRELASIEDPEGSGFEIDLIGYNLEERELCLNDKTDRSLQLHEVCSEILYITGTSVEMKLRFTLQKNGVIRVSNALV